MRSLTIDQARAVFALIRGDQIWRALLRVDALAFGVALLLGVAALILQFVAMESFAQAEQSFSEYLISFVIHLLVTVVTIILWRRFDVTPHAIMTWLWVGVLVAPLILISIAQIMFWPLRPNEQDIVRMIGILLIGLAVIAAFAWIAFRITRTMLGLSSLQAILFVCVDAALTYATVAWIDWRFGTSIFLTPEVKAQFFG